MALIPGQKFAHFTITRKLGEGGMGEVYLAEDQKLNRNVAIKILRPEYFDNPERLERFNREAKTAAKISHRNVMAIYDIGAARDEQSGQEINYIVMEYIEGESLTEYLQNRKPEIKDKLRLASHIAAGLAAAHKLGIVHRDIKTDNVLLDTSGDPKILDFGLAKPIGAAISGVDEDSTQTVTQAALTREGKILGTVTYMSPEQARGEQVDARSDVFSFGIMLYKMVTDAFPFAGSDPVSTIAKILEARQPSIRLTDETLPPELDRIIDKCLQKSPDDRYQDTRDLVVDLRNLRRQYESGISDTSDLPTAAIPRPKKKDKHWLTWPKLVFLGLLALPILGIIADMVKDVVRGPDGSEPVAVEIKTTHEHGAASPADGSLAILGFENKTGDVEYDWLTAGLPEILLTDLAQGGGLKLIGRTRVLDCLSEESETATDVPSHQECVNAAKSLGAGTVLSGSFYKLGDKLRIDARLEDVSSGQILLGEKVVGSDPFILVDSLTEKIAASLSVRREKLAGGEADWTQLALSDPQAFADSINAQVGRSLREGHLPFAGRDVTEITSSSVEAYKEYIIGLQKFNLGLTEQSIERFEKAIAIDSTFALPYMRIGMAHSFQNRSQQAAEYFNKALRFEDKLPVRERSLLDIYADTWLRQNFDDAFAKLQTFVGNYPDDKEARTIYALYLGQIIGNNDAAFAQLDTALAQDTRYPFALEAYASMYQRLNELDKAIEYYQLLKKYHPDSRNSYEALSALYRRQGEFDKAVVESQKLLELAPDSREALDQLLTISLLRRDFDGAGGYLEQIRKVSADDPYKMTDYYSSMAVLAGWQGEFKTMRKHLFNALSWSKKTGDTANIVANLQSISSYYHRLDQRDSAMYYLEKAHGMSNMFQSLSYSLLAVEIDTAFIPLARERYRQAFERIKQRVPAEFWELIEILGDIFEGYCRADTAAIIDARKKLLGKPGQENSGDILQLGRLQVLTGQHPEGIATLQRLLSGSWMTTNAMTYLRTRYYLGLAHEALGDTEKTLADYREVLKYWGKSDIELKEIADTRKRLARLTS
jgi:serine/threonine protein kinase/tetratricopeptide (TPR) repeat protein